MFSSRVLEQQYFFYMFVSRGESEHHSQIALEHHFHVSGMCEEKICIGYDSDLNIQAFDEQINVVDVSELEWTARTSMNVDRRAST